MYNDDDARWPSILICCIGFVKEMRPTTPYLTPYLMAPPLNFTDETLYSKVYPYWTYSYLVALVPVFLVSDLIRHKPIIVCEVLALIGVFSALILGRTVTVMQLAEIMYGVSTACEVAYYSYIYSVVKSEDYTKLTSYVRSAVLAGRCAAYAFSQVIISTSLGGYALLNYVTVASLLVTIVLTIALPNIPNPARLQAAQQSSSSSALLGGTRSRSKSVAHAVQQSPLSVARHLQYQWRCVRINCAREGVLKWSMWWALASCGYYQIGNYVQTLWVQLQSVNYPADIYNGLTETVNTLAGALLAFLMQYTMFVNWSVAGEAVLCVSSILSAVVLYASTITSHIFVAQGLYILYTMLYHCMITIVASNLALCVADGTHGLVIGCNTFAAIALQSLLTFVVVDSHGLNLHIITQFHVYASYHGLIGLLFLLMTMYTICRAEGGGREFIAKLVITPHPPSPPSSEGLRETTDL